MRPLDFVWWFLGSVAFLAVAVAWVRARRRSDPTELERLERRRIEQGVRAGTHTADGHRRCRHCDAAAVRAPLRVGRDEGLVGWLRGRIGAPARYRVAREPWAEAAYCEAHDELAAAEFRAYLLTFEARRLDEIRNAEVELARFERVGLDERVVHRVKMHEREVRKNDPAAASQPPASAKVVHLR